MLHTVITLQSFRTILKISTSHVSFFTRILCVSAIFNIIILNFAKKTFFSSICRNVLILGQNLRILLLKPTMVCLFFAFWPFLGILSIYFILFSRSVSVTGNVDKDITHTVRLQSNTNSHELWIIFPVTFLLLMVWCRQKIDK